MKIFFLLALLLALPIQASNGELLTKSNGNLSEICLRYFPLLKKPNPEQLQEVVAHIVGEGPYVAQLVNSSISRLKKQGATKEEAQQVLGAVLAKLLLLAEKDTVHARVATHIIFKGAHEIEKLQNLLSQLRQGADWYDPKLLEPFKEKIEEKKAEREGIDVAKEQKRLEALENSRSGFDSLTFYPSEKLKFPQTKLNIANFQIQVPKGSVDYPREKKSLQLELTAATNAIKNNEKILALGSHQIYELFSLEYGKAEVHTADLITVSFSGNGTPIFHIRECKSGKETALAYKQIYETTQQILKHYPNAQFGHLEVLVSKDYPGELPEPKKYRIGGQVIAVPFRRVEVQNFPVDENGVVFPKS